MGKRKPRKVARPAARRKLANVFGRGRRGVGLGSPFASRRRNLCMTPNRYGLRRNQRIGVVPMAKSLVKRPVLNDAIVVTGGLVAGAVLPTVIVKGLRRVGLMMGPVGTVAQVSIGVVGSAAAGIAVGILGKSRQTGILVAASGIAGMVSAVVIGKLLPALGMGDFPTPWMVLHAPYESKTASGFPTVSAIKSAAEGPSIGDFPTVEAVESAKAIMPGKTVQMGDFVPMSVALTAAPVQAGKTVQLNGLGMETTAESASQMHSVAEMFGLSGSETRDMPAEMEGFGYHV